MGFPFLLLLSLFFLVINVSKEEVLVFIKKISHPRHVLSIQSQTGIYVRSVCLQENKKLSVSTLGLIQFRF